MGSLRRATTIIWILANFLAMVLPGHVQADSGHSQQLNVTIRANWSGCDSNCDGNQDGNLVNSGNYTINITGTVKVGSSGSEYVNFEPESLTGSCLLQMTENILDKDCRQCNPIRTVKGNRTVTFGRDDQAIAFLQGFQGMLGAGFAQQLRGQLGPGYQHSLPNLAESRIISFGATGPLDMTFTTKDCPSCAATTETGQGGFAVGINADMGTRQSGSASWKTATHPMDTLGANVIDIGGPQQLGPEKDPHGKAQLHVTWSLGEIKPASLSVKTISFNHDGNGGSALQLRSEQDDSQIKAPEWTHQVDPGQPAAFVRGVPFKVKVLFGVEGKRIEKAEIWAEEEVLDQEGSRIRKGFGGVRKQMVTFSPGDREKEVDFTIRTPQPVVGVNRVKWFWRANIWYQGGDEPEETEIKTAPPGERDATEHTIYVVGAQPASGTTAYVYLVKKGCQWAEGQREEHDIFTAIWQNFWEIPCPEDTLCGHHGDRSGILTYSHDQTSGMTTIRLLQDGQGRCGAWARLFEDMVGSQGIKVTRLTIYPKKVPFRFENMVVGPGMAQGTTDPARAFTEHAIIGYKDRLYDPSYWKAHPIGPGDPITTYEEATFIAYCTAEGRNECVATCRGLITAERDTWHDFTECLLNKCSCHLNDPALREVYFE